MEIRLPAEFSELAQQLSRLLSPPNSDVGGVVTVESDPRVPGLERGSSSSRPWMGRPAMSPELSYGRHAGPPRWDARRAAVQVLLFVDQGEWYLPLTLRPRHLSRHAGQICFAGGSLEPGETERECAWREWCEELGEPGTTWHWVGELPTTFVFASNFLVTPQVAISPRRPQYECNPAEVAEVLELPVRALLEREIRGEHLEWRGPLAFEAPHFRWQGYPIWGATALILEMLVHRLLLGFGQDKTVPANTTRFGKRAASDIFDTIRGG